MFSAHFSTRRLCLLATAAFLFLPSLVQAQVTDHERHVASVVRDLDAKLQSEGALFAPFRLKYTDNVKKLSRHVATEPGQGQGLYTEWKVNGSGQFLPLGDTLTWLDPEHYTHPEKSEPVGSLLFAPAPGHEDALRNPVDFKRTHYSGIGSGERSVIHWIPVAPEGYRTVGLCFSIWGKPDPKQYWCVKEEYVLKVGSKLALSEDVSFFLKESLHVAAFEKNKNQVATTGKMLFLPPTYVTVNSQAEQEGMYPSALKMEQLVLTTSEIEPGDRELLPDAEDMDRTSPGLEKEIAVIPAIPSLQHPLDLRRMKTAFQYVTSEPFWQCQQTYSGYALNSKNTFKYIVGTGTEESNSFENSTSLSVTAEVGMEYGGASASISATYSRTYKVGGEKKETKNSSYEDGTELIFEKLGKAMIWQRYKRFNVRGGDGECVANSRGIEYGADDTDITYAEEQPNN